jgi:Ankyrin repeat
MIKNPREYYGERMSVFAQQDGVKPNPPHYTTSAELEAHVATLLEKLSAGSTESSAKLNQIMQGAPITPLHWSVAHGKAEFVQQLLSCGADVHHRNHWGANALILCVQAHAEQQTAKARGAMFAEKYGLPLTTVESGLHLSSNPYPFEQILQLLLDAGATWKTVFDDDRVLKFTGASALPGFPMLIKYIIAKQIELLTDEARQRLLAEHGAAMLNKNAELHTLRLQLSERDREIAQLTATERQQQTVITNKDS